MEDKELFALIPFDSFDKPLIDEVAIGTEKDILKEFEFEYNVDEEDEPISVFKLTPVYKLSIKKTIVKV